MNAPLATAWANQSLEPSVRATVFSMQSQADALGQIIGGPILGALATAFTLRAGLVGAGLILLPALFLLAVFSFGARRIAHAPRSYSRLSS
jgi:DHA3 family tetracycline resistance protein-like MFS transporter